MICNRKLHNPRIILVFVLILTGTFMLSACNTAEDEQVTVGMLNLLPPLDVALDGFKAGMIEFGYVEADNINYIYDGATPDPSALADKAQALVEAEVDLIFCVTTPACLAAQAATAESEIPVVFVAVTDPLAVGLIEEYAQPGGNFTGVTTGARNFTNEGRRLEWLTTAVPDVQRIYLPHNPEDPTVTASLPVVEEAAGALGLELVLQEVRTPEEVVNALENIPDNVEAMFVLADQLVVADTPAVTSAASGHGLALSTPNSTGPQLGGLISYGSDFFASGSQSARLADLILRGADPAELPAETPEFFLVVNTQTAAAIALEISDEVLRQADTIIRE